MRKRIIIIAATIFSLLPVLLTAFSGTVSALNTGFSTEQFPEEKISKFISNVNISLLTEEPVRTAIKCFDVNDYEMIAIDQQVFDEKTVCVYSKDGVFQYGYTFNCDGNIGLEWDGNNINIYFVRGSVIASVNPNGEILEVLSVQNTIENNSYVNHFFHSTERNVGDTEYAVRNNMGILNIFAASYSQLTVTNSDGKETVLYDVNSEQFVKILTLFILTVVTVVIVLTVIIRQFVKKKHGVNSIENRNSPGI